MKSRKPLSRNAHIIIANICAACVLLFCCSFFFFQNLHDIAADFGYHHRPSPRALFAFPLVGGICFVCFYIMHLVFNLESNTPHAADRFDLAYRIVFSLTLCFLILRSFFGDMLYQDAQFNPFTLVILLGIASGIITWCIPKIRDNDNTEF